MDEQALGERLGNWSKNFTSFGRLFGGAVTGGVEVLEGTLGTNVYGEKLDTVDRILSIASGAASIGANVGLAEIKIVKTPEIDMGVFNEMYKKAPAAKMEIANLATQIAAKNQGIVATAPLKSEVRALEKITLEYGGDVSKIKDIARITIIVTDAQIPNVVNQLESAGATVKIISSEKNALGYSGVNATIKTESGLIAEIQVNSPAMIYAKEPEAIARGILGDKLYAEVSSKASMPGGQGHYFYELWRNPSISDIQRKAIEQESNVYYDTIRRNVNGH